MKNKKKVIIIFLVISLFFITILNPIGYATQQDDEYIILQIKQTPNKI